MSETSLKSNERNEYSYVGLGDFFFVSFINLFQLSFGFVLFLCLMRGFFKSLNFFNVSNGLLVAQKLAAQKSFWLNEYLLQICGFCFRFVSFV